jgi:hypothetical protein
MIVFFLANITVLILNKHLLPAFKKAIAENRADLSTLSLKFGDNVFIRTQQLRNTSENNSNGSVY